MSARAGGLGVDGRGGGVFGIIAATQAAPNRVYSCQFSGAVIVFCYDDICVAQIEPASATRTQRRTQPAD